MAFVLLFLFLGGFRIAEGVEGYDCESSVLESTISLMESSNCADPRGETLIEEELPGGVIQRAPWKAISARVCSQVVTTRTVYCTWLKTTQHKLNAGNVEGFIGESISADQCAALHRTGKVTQQGKTVTVQGHESVSWTNSTAIGASGYCAHWTGEETFSLFVLSKGNASVVLRSDASGRFSEATYQGESVVIDSSGNSGTTPTGHTLLWSAGAIPSCFLETLFKGNVTKVTDAGGAENAMVKEKGVGFVVSDRQTLCNMKLWSTNVPMTYVFWGDVVELPDVTHEPTVGLPQHMLALIQGLFTTTAVNQAKSASEIRKTMCSIEGQVHRDIIYGVSTDPDMTAYRLIGKRGWRLITAGAAVHLYRCTPKEVRITPTTECALDVPVMIAGSQTIYYLDPVSFVIHTTSNAVSCSDPRLPYILIRNQWYRVGQSVVPVKAPDPVPSVVSGPSEVRLPNSHGLYSRELVSAAAEHTSIEEAIRFSSQMTVAHYASGVGIRDPQRRLKEIQPVTSTEHKFLTGLAYGAYALGPLTVVGTIIAAILNRRSLLKWVAGSVAPSLFALFSSYHQGKTSDRDEEDVRAIQ
jgi:hypothetical protein